MSWIHCLVEISRSEAVDSSSYEARVRTLLVMEFMMSPLGAFMMTSRVKFVGRHLHSSRISWNSKSWLSVGFSPKSRRYAVFSKPNSCSPSSPINFLMLYPRYHNSPGQGTGLPSGPEVKETIFEILVSPVSTPFPLISRRPRLTPYFSNSASSIVSFLTSSGFWFEEYFAILSTSILISSISSRYTDI